MAWQDYMDHERARWRSMTYQQLRTRLTRITIADKLRAYIEVASAAARPDNAGLNVNVNLANALNLLGAATARAQELGHRSVVDIGATYIGNHQVMAPLFASPSRPVPTVDPSNPRNLSSSQIQVVRQNLIRDMPSWGVAEFSSFFNRRNHLLRAEIGELDNYLHRIASNDPRTHSPGATRLNNQQALTFLQRNREAASQYGYRDFLQPLDRHIDIAQRSIEQFQHIFLAQAQQREEEIRLEEMRRENAERRKKGIRRIRFCKKEEPEPRPWKKKKKIAEGLSDVDIEDLLSSDDE